MIYCTLTGQNVKDRAHFILFIVIIHSIHCTFFQIDNVRFRELTHEQVFGSMHEQFMRM